MTLLKPFSHSCCYIALVRVREHNVFGSYIFILYFISLKVQFESAVRSA